MISDRSYNSIKPRYNNQQSQACVSLNESKLNRLNKSNHFHDKSSKNFKRELNIIEGEKGFNCDSICANPTRSSRKTSKMAPLDRRQIDLNKLDRIAFKIDHKNKVKANSSIFYNAGMRATFTSSPLTKSIAFLGSTILIVIFVLHNSSGLDRNQALALNCYHCSSVDNPDCGETLTGNANLTETNCEKLIGQPAKVCRKIVQYIEKTTVVIRSCGYIDSQEEKDRKNQCYKRSGTFAIMMQSCNCYTDLCNHSASLVPNQTILLTTIGILSLITMLFSSPLTVAIRKQT